MVSAITEAVHAPPDEGKGSTAMEAGTAPPGCSCVHPPPETDTCGTFIAQAAPPFMEEKLPWRVPLVHEGGVVISHAQAHAPGMACGSPTRS